MQMKLPEIVAALGLVASDVENWLKRLELNTHYAETRPGRSREFYCENVLELALMTGYTRLGMPAATAVEAVKATIADAASERVTKEWAVFASGNWMLGHRVDSLDEVNFGLLTAKGNKAIPGFSALQVGEIVRRVEKLFAPQKVEA